MSKFSLYLLEFYPDVQTIYQLDRDIIEDYLIYRKTESKKQNNLAVELKGLKATFEEFSKIYENKQFTNLMLNTDIPSSPKISFQTYSIREQEAWMKAVPYMEKQVGRAFLLHILLGTRISEILTLKQDCISKKEMPIGFVLTVKKAELIQNQSQKKFKTLYKHQLNILSRNMV